MNDKDKSIDKSQSKLSVTSNAGASSSSATGKTYNLINKNRF